MWIAVGVMVCTFMNEKGVARQKSPLVKRIPLSLEELSRSHFAVQNLDFQEIVEALQVLENSLGCDVRLMRPTDRFSEELAFLEAEVFDNDLCYMWSRLADEFRLSQKELDNLALKVDTVQSFIEAYCFLKKYPPGAIDWGSFPPTKAG